MEEGVVGCSTQLGFNVEEEKVPEGSPVRV
jgi:hypothetical protein